MVCLERFAQVGMDPEFWVAEVLSLVFQPAVHSCACSFLPRKSQQKRHMIPRTWARSGQDDASPEERREVVVVRKWSFRSRCVG
jgi:hypothetical protein